MNKSPLVTLNNGVQMPVLGLGVYQAAAGQAVEAVKCAVANGYRLIDTAAAYGNERQVGVGIAQCGVPRSDLFVTTKLWIDAYGYDRALRAFDTSLAALGLDYVDLYLLHWPTPSNFDNTVAAYHAAERLLAEQRVRAIGVCNFKPRHLQDLIARAKVIPAVNQVELHPMFNQDEVRDANASHGIMTQSWSPIGGVYINHPADPNAVMRLLDHPLLAEIAGKEGKSPAQVVLRWHIQHGLCVIPKSVHPERIVANIDVFDFRLATEDMAAIDALDTGVRGGPDPDVFDLEFLAARMKK